MSSNILITGVSGMIGSTVALKAKKLGFNVIGISRNRARYISSQLGIEILEQNILDKDLDLKNINTIIHCATSNDIVSKNFKNGIELTVYGTKNLLDYALSSRVEKFIFLSTAQIYGSDLEGFYNIKYPHNCISSYSLNHLYGEELCKMYNSIYPLDVTIVRPSNIYGEPNISTVNRETLVPTCFVKSLLEKNEITILSSGLQHRDFIHQEAVADFIIHSLSSNDKKFKIINACTGKTKSILDVAKICLEEYKIFSNKLGLINVLGKSPSSQNNFSFVGTNYESFNKMNDYNTIRKTIKKLLIYYS